MGLGLERDEPLSWEEWDKAADSSALTIEDIISLKPGTKHQLLIQDRNVGDSIGNLGHDDGKPRRPTAFFSGLKDTFTYRDGLSGCMDWNWGEHDDDFTFQLLSEMKRMWYPLDRDGFFPLAKKHWTDMPLTTKVGWRGRAMRWSDLAQLPSLYTTGGF